MLDAAYLDNTSELNGRQLPKPVDPMSYFRGRLVGIERARVVRGLTIDPPASTNPEEKRMANIAKPPTMAIAALIVFCTATSAQTISPSVRSLLAPHGLQRFPKLYVRALDVFLKAENLYEKGDYEHALEVMEQLWTGHPPGGDDWARCRSDIAGINIGRPPCYYALRMLTDCARWRLQRKTHGPEQSDR